MELHDKKKFIENCLQSLDKLCELHKTAKEVHHSLNNLYPVAVVRNNIFYVFDLDELGRKYEFVLENRSSITLPNKVLASFPLEFYDMKASAVISQDAFNSIEGYMFIFHEFVHCFQWINDEQEIRGNLILSKRAKEEKNYTWEITHPFPYEDKKFIEQTLKLCENLKNNDYRKVLNYYKGMKDYLKDVDYEYMIWQQYKEGFARYVENLVRKKFLVESNSLEVTLPLSRECFYTLGSAYIDLLLSNNGNLQNNLKELFMFMFSLS
ncbi:hypothetical protein J2Z44_003586 [Clostridium punense]|uniref:Elongation factor P hydroxylase n=1 Tax=Clostridium punense TaxID=1054297 RepID=A0ABS4K7H4_9CLOT|nr:MULTISPECIES: hypothetical protein [Clostridium]EQB88592.1 hypothetical protein M918_04130 [Clostridium sp. BL8]MBP2023744.1 hypothetical protein [Clostridium punense]